MFYGDKTRFAGAPFSLKNEIRVAKNCNTPLSPYNLGRNKNYTEASMRICLGSERIKLRNKDRKLLVPRLLFSVAFFFSFFLSLSCSCLPLSYELSLLPYFLSFSLFFQVGQKRFIGGIMAAFTLFNNVADFMGRVNNVVGWFDNIDRFMGSGGTQSESQINVEQINELKTRLDGLATDVESKIEHRMFMFTMYNGFASLRKKWRK